jgi:hypothetical protein
MKMRGWGIVAVWLALATACQVRDVERIGPAVAARAPVPVDIHPGAFGAGETAGDAAAPAEEVDGEVSGAGGAVPEDAAPAADATVAQEVAAAPAPDAAVAPEVGQECRSALLVVGKAKLDAVDTAVRDRLAVHLAVEVRVEGAVAAEDAAGKALVVITASASVAVGASFRDVEVPVMLFEPNLMAAMQMAGEPATDHGATPPEQTKLAITDPAHPLAADLKGEVTVYRTPWRLSWAAPGEQAVTVATVPGNPRQQVIFAYPARAMMVGRRAPARRLGFFMHDNPSANLTGDALRLLDAAIEWMAGARAGACGSQALGVEKG